MKSIISKENRIKAAIYNETHGYYDIDGVKFYLKEVEPKVGKLTPLASPEKGWSEWKYDNLDAEIIGGEFDGCIAPILSLSLELK